jgi:hypothetical protein
MAARDLDLLLFAVPGQLEHFHTVLERRRDRVEVVRGREKRTFCRSNGTSR